MKFWPQGKYQKMTNVRGKKTPKKPKTIAQIEHVEKKKEMEITNQKCMTESSIINDV